MARIFGGSGGSAPDFSPAYRQIFRGVGRGSTAGAAGTNYMLLTNASADQSSIAGTASSYAQFPYLAAADYAVTGKTPMLRVRALLFCGATALTMNVTVGLRAVTLAAGNVTAGALVTGSDATFTTPAANTANRVESADFALPADGVYIPAYTVSATPNQGFNVFGELALHYV